MNRDFYVDPLPIDREEYHGDYRHDPYMTREYWAEYVSVTTDSENESDAECEYCKKKEEISGIEQTRIVNRCDICSIKREKRKKREFFADTKQKKCTSCKVSLNRENFEYKTDYFHIGNTVARTCKSCAKKTFIEKCVPVSNLVAKFITQMRGKLQPEKCVSCDENVCWNPETLSIVYPAQGNSNNYFTMYKVCNKCILTKHGIKLFNESNKVCYREKNTFRTFVLLRTDVQKTVNCLACLQPYTNLLSEGICDVERGVCDSCSQEIVTSRVAKRFVHCPEGHLIRKKDAYCEICRKTESVEKIPGLLEELNSLSEFDDYKEMLKIVNELQKKLTVCANGEP